MSLPDASLVPMIRQAAWPVMSGKPRGAGSAGVMVFRQMVARSATEWRGCAPVGGLVQSHNRDLSTSTS